MAVLTEEEAVTLKKLFTKVMSGAIENFVDSLIATVKVEPSKPEEKPKEE